MDTKSPPPCPPTVTVRRNPPRKARATPASAIPLHVHLSSPSLARDLFSTEVCENPNTTEPSPRTLSENLKVYLRIRPLAIQKSSKNVAGSKNAWPKNPNIKSNARPKAKKSCEICVEVNEDLHSVTVSTPQALQETKRVKSEVYGGFSHVFASEASQIDVYEEMVKPLVDDLLNGKSGMLAAMGPSGSGKTHTVFGSAREPGMVPLALRRIFIGKESSGTQLTRVFYMSMFEISSEKKAERMIDLLQDGGDIGMQNSVVKGVQEAVVCDAQQAESLIARGMLKRATAMTNSNSQSSRSQCIINIRCDSERGDKEVDGKTRSTMLTIVDLAGAEREKKTGNQGARLLESNFINNTSMVFGLCLRSLLEYQKSRNKPLQKHYQNSLLTRYMRDYLEGKKRMMLILTVKPEVEDYLDTSFLLRQASPFTKIKFKPMEEQVNLTCNKRPNQALPRAEQLKKMKFNNSESSLIDEENNDRGLHSKKKVARKVAKDCLTENIDDENLNEIPVLSDKFLELEIREKSSLKSDYCKDDAEKDRQQQIMQGLAKAMWTVLKQFKQKLEVVEIENGHLRDSLANEKSRRLDLENECASQNMRLIDLENELNEFKSQCTCSRKASSDVLPLSSDNASCSLSQHQMAGLQEVKVGLHSTNSTDGRGHVVDRDHLPKTDLISHGLALNIELHQRQSERNKQIRGQLQLLHHMGKKSFALIKEIMRKKLGRYPTRAELFEECYYRADGSTTCETIKEVIVQMKEVDAQAPQNSNVNPTIYDPNDSFAQILGKDKDGQLRMYGLGVTQTDVYGEKPSRATLLRQAIEYKAKFLEAVDKYETLNKKLETYETLNKKLETLSAYVHGTQPVGNSDATNSSPTRQVNSEDASLTISNENVASGYVPTITPNEQVDALSPPLTSPNNQRSIGSTSHPMPIQGGSYVVLKSLGNMDEIVATGIVDKIDNVRANGVDLGPEFCQVVIHYQVKKDARLIFPQNHIQTIGGALGVPIAWPISLVTLDHEFHC